MDGPLAALHDAVMCPITRQVMLDPVVAMDGHSYERSAIEAWLTARAVPTSPLTNEPLPSTQLLPNTALKKAAAAYHALKTSALSTAAIDLPRRDELPQYEFFPSLQHAVRRQRGVQHELAAGDLFAVTKRTHGSDSNHVFLGVSRDCKSTLRERYVLELAADAPHAPVAIRAAMTDKIMAFIAHTEALCTSARRRTRRASLRPVKKARTATDFWFEQAKSSLATFMSKIL
ncbi:hypothetical protein SDRG_13926 [Saprolegnia diclina VS20]|uniref:U-box domain-containing protein n=1 Tax=Saprolegnia diclina (strain VS20) TaxID=1156394 RepID=T0PSB7_SAPDV|nr:hypothetical protein SDRG_13926 [Saprolegnia diclina VS20]EQC28379.1 hypothetical protein SDRG_13926 [Saprolegnia diclina VS20]|eukprot:XP_008618249.1 hypothetical protein SDRG_13926 [Saprolegnia diclina VS20]